LDIRFEPITIAILENSHFIPIICVAFHAIYAILILVWIEATLQEESQKMSNADRIREYATEKYVLPARQQKQRRFSIRVGDVVRELKMNRAVPAVCSALKTGEFRQFNDLLLVDVSGPKSGQSTTVVYTYEFAGSEQTAPQAVDPWSRIRGILKGVFAELGGGDAYLRAERNSFHPIKESK
jgi:hypothetical protein